MQKKIKQQKCQYCKSLNPTFFLSIHNPQMLYDLRNLCYNVILLQMHADLEQYLTSTTSMEIRTTKNTQILYAHPTIAESSLQKFNWGNEYLQETA